jgi:hypothetical protein
MKLTSQEYADLVVSQVYKVPNLYNLARAIARVADKYAKWTRTSIERDIYAQTEGANLSYAYEQKYEADIKCEAYRLALLMLTDKLPK